MNKKPNEIKKLKKIAESNGFSLVDELWKGRSKTYEFQSNLSKKKYFFVAANILDKKWPKTDEYYLQELKNIAKQNNGFLISQEWKGSNEKYEFAFHNHQRFFAITSDIKKAWPKDPKKYFNIINSRTREPQDFIDEMQKEAEKYGGKLLSEKWLGHDKEYDFEFSDNTKFSFPYSSFRTYGFPKDKTSFLKKSLAAKQNHDYFLNELENLAKDNSCTLESKEWIGSNKYYEFKTKNGDLFKLRADTLKIKGWPQNLDNHIYLQDRKLMTDEQRIEELNLIAKSRGGILLEKKWLGDKHSYKFKDANNIEFSILPSNLRKGGWSPNEGLISEPICRKVLEHLFNTKFNKNKKILTPEFTGYTNNLELDGYSEELCIAFEYQGDPSHWDKKNIRYEEVSKRDNIKKKTCEQLGIILIEIPPFEEKRNKWSSLNVLNHVLTAIETKFKSIGKPLPNLNTDEFKVDLSDINHGIKMLNQLKEEAKKYNIEVLSKSWYGNKEKHQFRFATGEVFEAVAGDFKKKPPKDAKTFFKFKNAHLRTKIERFESFKQLVEELNCILLETTWLGIEKKHAILTSENKQFNIFPKDLVYQKDKQEKLLKIINK